MTIEQRKKAFEAFQARAKFVRDLAEDFDVARDENGELVFNNVCKEEQFYEQLARYDAEVSGKGEYAGTVIVDGEEFTRYINVKI